MDQAPQAGCDTARSNLFPRRRDLQRLEGGTSRTKERDMTGNPQAGAHRPVIASMRSPAGVTISYERFGKGPPLVMVHGAFSDHRTNWEFVAPLLGAQFTVYAIARRGRGLTSATEGHSIADEAADLIALIRSIGGLVHLLGHSYGAHVALDAAAQMPAPVRKLVLYEAPWPHLMDDTTLARLEPFAKGGDWDGFAVTFFRDVLTVPVSELDALRASDLWPPIVNDAKASLGDMRALNRYRFDAERFRGLSMPVLLQTGSESPCGLYVTDALVGVLPDAHVAELAGQAHEGMTTAPDQYAAVVRAFLLG
jgi:pimeloyl-ACP methyl ester carboxylesterase